MSRWGTAYIVQKGALRGFSETHLVTRTYIFKRTDISANVEPERVRHIRRWRQAVTRNGMIPRERAEVIQEVSNRYMTFCIWLGARGGD